MRTRVACQLVLWLSLLLAACAPRVQPLSAPTPAAGRPVRVLVVTLSGGLDTVGLARCHRALREAKGEGVGWVVFRLQGAGDSQADSVHEVQSLLDHLQASDIATAALVEGHVQAGAAYLALCCDRVYCTPGAELGADAPAPTLLEQLSFFGEDDAEQKRLLAYRQELRQRLEKRNEKRQVKLRPEALLLCEGMVDHSLQLVRALVRKDGIESTQVLTQQALTGLQGSGAVVVQSQLLPRPVTLSATEMEDAGIAQGVVKDRDALWSDAFGAAADEVGELTPNWSEHMVAWLAMLYPFLLGLGFVLLVVEIKTPGIGLPGVLGAAFLGLALFYSYLVGLAEFSEILLFFLGLAAIAVEILVLPGTIVFGAIGFVSLVAALVLSRQSFVVPHSISEQDILLQNLTNLTLLFVAVLACTFVLWRLLPRIPVFNRVFLAAPTDGGGAPAPAGVGPAGDPRVRALVGRTAVAATVLRPAGAIELDGERLDVVTAGDYVAAGTPVRIVAVEGPRIVVERADGGERGSTGLVLLLAVVGLCLLVAEVVFVSFGAIAVMSGLALISAVFLAFQDSTGFGVTMLVVEAMAAPMVFALALRMLPNTRVGKAILLDGPPPGQGTAAAEDPELRQLLHKKGIVTAALRPAGFARIDGRKIDVVTRGEMLAEGTAVRVVEVAGNRVVVAQDR